MATFYSNNAYLANKAGGANQAVPASEVDGKLRIVYFQINLATVNTSALDGTTVAGTSVAAGDTVVLGKIPAGYKILRGVLTQTVSLGTATISIGLAGADGSGFYTGTTSDAPALLRAAATSTATDTDVNFGITNALGLGFTTTKDNNLTMTTGVAALPATGIINGYVICSAA